MTGPLLTRVPAAFHGGINEVLLTGWWWRWRIGAGGVAAARAASRAVLIDLEGHGREEVLADVDLSRTVGWFTSLFPVRLDAGALDLEEALAGGPALGRALKLDQGADARGAGHGLGYGLLRYLNPETASQLERLCGAADRLQLSGALCGTPGSGGLGCSAGGGDAWAAAAIPRCRWRTRWR